MKPNSARERILLVLLPGALVVLVYAFFFRPALQEKVAAAETTAQGLRETPITIDGNRRLQQELETILTEERSIQSRLERAESDVILPPGFAQPKVRARALAEINRLIDQNDLLLIDQAPVSKAEATVPDGLDQLIQSVSKSLPANVEPGFRRLRFVGRYEDAYLMLRELTESDQPVIPVSIRMQRSLSEPDLRWELFLWM